MQQYNLVLSGGGARGFAHLGVIKALQEKNIGFHAISATSAGSMVGAFLCDGYSVEETINICRKELPFTKLNFRLSQGWLSLETLQQTLEKYLRNKTFERLKHPFHVSVTDLNTGKQVILNSGDVIPAVMAASAIPVVISPVVINNIPYADGGVSSNLPVEPFLNSDLKIIGVNVNPIDDFNVKHGVRQQVDRIVHLILRQTILRQLNHVDVFLEPPALKNYGLFDTKKMDEIIKIGYDYTIKFPLPAN